MRIFGAFASQNLREERRTGVSDVMARRMAWQETLVQVAREQLFLMPAGEMNENSSDLISVGMRNLLETASEQFD